MTDSFIETLQSWQTFYFTMGGASSALIGLMFVALSLGMRLVAESGIQEWKSFVTPSVFYFVSVLLISCAMLIPELSPTMLAALLGLGGSFGFVRTMLYTRELVAIAQAHQDFDLGDWLGQVILPVATYLLIVMTAVGFLVNQWALAFAGIWVATVLLLICAIANTWSLVVWIIEQRNQSSIQDD